MRTSFLGNSDSWFFLGVASLAAIAACGGTEAECRLGADCESGQCSADGLCVLSGGGSSSGQTGASSGNASSSSGGSGSSGGSSSGGSSSGSTSSSSGSSGVGCVANNDGTITRAEVPLQVGLAAKFLISDAATVNMAGTVIEGTTVWDLSVPLNGDREVPVNTTSTAGTWFEQDFPGASYSVPLTDGTIPSLGILKVSDTKLSLMGFVSSEDEDTNIAYDKLVTTLEFPMTLGKEWSTLNAAGSGKLATYTIGPLFTIKDSYSSKVDKVGAVKTPYGLFPAMRVVTTLERVANFAGGSLTTKTIAFVSECAGTIAKVTSTNGETSNDFTEAAEVQRLTP